MDLRDFKVPLRYVEKKKKLEEQGFVFKPYEREDATEVFNFLRECFPSLLPPVRSLMVQGRAERNLIIVLGKNRKVCGFVMRGMDGTDERFGPFAVRPDLQGTGVGTILFHDMMENMIRNRIFHTYFLWTTGRNLEIYATWGMKIIRRFAMFHKILP
jgi:GNAT superfamily N-acetyltransferase